MNDPMVPRRSALIANDINRRLERMMPVLTPLGVVLGLVFSRVFIQLRPFIPWLFGLMTLSGALKLRARELGAAIRHPLPLIIFFTAAHLVMPLLVLGISGFFFTGDTDTLSGFVLLFSVPTAVSGFIWISMYRGDTALSLAIILLDTILAPFVVPFTVSSLLGTSISLDMSGMALSLVFMVVIPTIIGIILNETSGGKIPALISPYLAPVSKFCLMMVVSANVSAVAPKLDFRNPLVWKVGLFAILFTVLAFLIALLAGLLGRFKRDRRVTVFFSIGQRNISAAATLAIGFFPEAAALPAILGIIFQQTLSSIMARISFGPPGREEKAAGAESAAIKTDPEGEGP